MSAALVKEIFGASTSLYDVLGCDKAATAEQIKRAYYKKALQWVSRSTAHPCACAAAMLTIRQCEHVQHPDKAGDDSEATKKFQALGFIHSILSDDNKRKAYDRKGKLEDVEEEGDSEAAEAWYDYWRTFFPVVTEEDLVKFEDEYRARLVLRGIRVRATALAVDVWRLERRRPPLALNSIALKSSPTNRSEEERLDVLKAYTLCEGDVDDMLDNIMCSR